MFIGILNITAAIILSLVSAFFSITGIQTIFAGAAIGATLMGAALEFSKISATIWLHSWWKKVNKLLKYYLVFAVFVLIVVSSLGIFGYLSKAYIGQQQPASEMKNQIERIDSRIARQERDIERSESALESLDESIAIYFEYDQVTNGLEQREAQQDERNELNQQITNAQNTIDELRDTRVRLQNEVEQIEVNVGPIRYMAALMYGEDDAESNYDNAARFFIILLVLVFDPFAVLMMVSGSIALESASSNKKKSQRKSKRKASTTPKKSSKKATEQPKKRETNQELPMETEEAKSSSNQKDSSKVVEVDMSEYFDPEQIREIKEQSEHRPLRQRKQRSSNG